MATHSGGTTSIWRRASHATRQCAQHDIDHSVNSLKQVTPAHKSGAVAAGSMSSGTETTASLRRVQYSPYPPSLNIPTKRHVSPLPTHRQQRHACTVDVLFLASDVVALAATGAGHAMTAVPTAADALADLPQLLGGRDRDDVADDLVSGDAGVLDREVCGGNLLITAANISSGTRTRL